jgi:hypothetical protein
MLLDDEQAKLKKSGSIFASSIEKENCNVDYNFIFGRAESWCELEAGRFVCGPHHRPQLAAESGNVAEIWL